MQRLYDGLANTIPHLFAAMAGAKSEKGFSNAKACG